MPHPGVTVGDPKLLTCLSAALGLRYFWTRFPRGNKAWPATAQRCCGLPAAFSSWKKERTCWPTALPGSPETKGFPKIRSSGSFQLSGKVSGCGAGPQEKQKPLQATKKRGAMEVPGCYSNFQVGSALGSKFLPRGPFGDVDLQHWLLLQGCIAVARGSPRHVSLSTCRGLLLHSLSIGCHCTVVVKRRLLSCTTQLLVLRFAVQLLPARHLERAGTTPV